MKSISLLARKGPALGRWESGSKNTDPLREPQVGEQNGDRRSYGQFLGRNRVVESLEGEKLDDGEDCHIFRSKPE